MWSVYSILYAGALLYEYITKSFMFAMSNFCIKFYEKYFKKIESQDDITNLTINIHKILNFVFYRNFFINLIMFMSAWNYFLYEYEVIWNVIAFPIASFFFMIIGLRAVGDFSGSIYVYGTLIGVPYFIAFISTIMPFPHGFWSIMMTFVPLIIFKQVFYYIYAYWMTESVEDFKNDEAKEEHFHKMATKIRNLNFGWFSIPMVLFGLYLYLFHIFAVFQIHISHWIILYIIFFVGIRSAGGFISLYIFFRSRFEEDEEINFSSFTRYLYLYGQGVTVDEVEVDIWLKKVVIHSMIASFLLAIVMAIF